jgi:hypothetical protein
MRSGDKRLRAGAVNVPQQHVSAVPAREHDTQIPNRRFVKRRFAISRRLLALIGIGFGANVVMLMLRVLPLGRVVWA